MSSYSYIHIRVESTTLPDGNYELVLEQEEEHRGTQANWIEAEKAPNQSSEEPKANSEQEGKPRSMTHLSNYMHSI